MFLSFLKVGMLAAAFGVISIPEADKPACNAENLGRMWPDAANSDPRLFTKLARCGALQVCTRQVWRYRWESPTVTLGQLRQGARPARPGACEESQEAGAAPK